MVWGWKRSVWRWAVTEPYRNIKVYNGKEENNLLKLITLFSLRIPKPFSKYKNDKKKELVYKTYDRLNRKEVKKKIIIKKDGTNKNNEQYEDHSDYITKKLLYSLPNEFGDNYEKWVNTGLCLYNTNKNYLSMWDEWSKQNDKYEPGKCEQKWRSFNNKADNTLTIGSLHHWVKENNLDKYKEIMKDKNIINCICAAKNQFPEQSDLSVIGINKYEDMYTMPISDLYCAVCGKKHKYKRCSMLLTSNGRLYQNCSSKAALGKCYPKNGCIVIEKQSIINIFGNINVTNYYGKEDDNKNTFMYDNNYKIFQDKKYNELIIQALNGKPHHIAQVLWYKNNEVFKCTKNKAWYSFGSHKWEHDEEEIRKKITSYLPIEFRVALEFYKNLSVPKMSDQDKKILNSKIKKIEDLILSLGDTGLIANIMIEAGHIFYSNDKTFGEKLDKNIYLLGFNNGVYDLEKNELRKGKPNDCITMSTKYDYVEEYSDKKQELLNFLTNIIPNKREFDYMMTFLGSLLQGENELEIFHIFSGKGRNGKTKLAELLHKTLGDYAESVQCNILTKEQPSASNPRPDLLVLKNKRVMITSEPEKNQKINSSFMKGITGNDRIIARNLYSKDIDTFLPSFGVILLCNDVPPFDNNDEAIWNRCRCIEFPIKFVKNPVGELQRKIDTKIGQKISKWRNDFMLLLLEYYERFVVDGLDFTEKVLRYTNMIKDDNDIYKAYLDERTKESTGHIFTSTLYLDFKGWYIVNNGNKNVPSNREFCKEIRNHIEIEQSIRIGDKCTKGVKNLELIDDTYI